MHTRRSIFTGWIAASLMAMAFTALAAPAAAQEKFIESTPAMRTPLLVANADFESGLDRWATSASDARAYEFAVDTAVFHGGKQSIRIRSVAGERDGSLYQVLPIAALRGSTVELSGWLKTDNATGGGAVLTLRVFGADNRLLEYNLMHHGPVKGTTDWTRYSIPVKVSKNATDLEIGVTLNNKGTVWVDDLELNVISHER